MAIGISKDGPFENWQIPLLGLSDNYKDAMWDDNSWIVSQLRQLATLIEEKNPQIISIGVNTNRSSGIPELTLNIHPRSAT